MPGIKIIVNPAPVASLVDLGYITSSCSLSSILGPSTPEPVHPKPKSRKSVKGDTSEMRHNRKIKNMKIDALTVLPLPNCTMKCNTKSSKEERQLIWEDFRQIQNFDQRYRYLAHLIQITSPKRAVVSQKNRKLKRDKVVRYFLKTNNYTENEDNSLCKTCFMTLYRITPAKIQTVINKKVNNGQSPDIQYNRGRQEPANKISQNDKEQASLFLLSVPAYESHYGRADSDKKYLPQYHTKSSLYEDFKNSFPGNRVHLDMFSNIFKELNLSIKTKACDTCKRCDELLVCLQSAKSEEIREQIKIKQVDHWQQWKSAVSEKKSDALKFMSDPSVQVIAYDLEQILPTPFLTTSVAFYSRQLSTFNLTIFDLKSKLSLHNVWHEGMAMRGSNEINSCLYQYGRNLNSKVKHLIKYSDRCPGQNMNINSIIADLYLVQKSPTLEIIDTKFLVSGHTHMECDGAHAIIERYKKRFRGNVEVPDDWIDLIKNASAKFEVKKMTSEHFLDFSGNLKNKLVYRKVNTANKPWKFADILWIRVEKKNPCSFKYKSSYDLNEDFKEVSLLRKNLKTQNFDLTAEKKYAGDNMNAIPKEKKDDLINLFKYISPQNHDFFKSLKEIVTT